MTATRTSITLPVVDYSEHGYQEIDTGAWVHVEDHCACGERLADGDQIRYRADRPMHLACYRTAVESLAVRSAWVAIAEDMARAPSRHNAATVRAVLENLARLARLPEGAAR